MITHRTLKLFLLAILFPTIGNTAPLSLEKYLDEVTEQSPGLTAARMNAEAGALRAEGAEVLTFPYLHGSLNTLHDETETSNPPFMGTATKVNLYSVGLGWNTPVGLNAKYTFNTTKTDIDGASALPLRNFHTSYNRIDLSQSLVRNGFGSQIRAQKSLVHSGNTAQSLADQYRQLAKTVEAETIYWRLAMSRTAVQVQRDVLSRAERLLQWAKRRVSLQLGDQSDLLQAQASYDLHRLELSNALEEERNAARAFNALRNQVSEVVPETLSFPSIEELVKVKGYERQGTRLDVKAAEEKTKAVQAQAQLDKEVLKPNVDVVASYAWTGRDANSGTAISEGLMSTHPVKAIGINFSVPLDFPTWKRAMRGADLQIEAARFEYEQTKVDEAKDWEQITSRLADARSRLALLQSIENVQREKFENERQRLLRGRTTTYQAVSFEQDYASAQLLRLRTQSEVLQLLAQMKLYRGSR